MTAQVEVRYPEDQQEGTEAVLSRWLKAPGDSVSAYEPIAEVETDKVVVEVPAPVDGTLGEICVNEGDPAQPGELLCTLLTQGAGGESAAPKDSVQERVAQVPGLSRSDQRDRLSPAVRIRLMKHGLDASLIEGSGRGGRLTVHDVENFLDKPPGEFGLSTGPSGLAAENIPHDSMRKKIAANMVTSLLHTAPHVTAVFEADLSAVMRHRKAHKEEFSGRGTPLTLTAYFVAAATAAIARVPQVNSRWHEEHLEVFGEIHMGIGTALGDNGLIVPVLHDAGQMGLPQIAAGLADLTGRARDGKLKPEDVRGGTFTISNHGVSGSLLATPIIINQPQSAILGVGKIEKRVKVMEVDGEDVLSIRPMCYISLTIDHRVLDGFQTNAFLAEMVASLENWPA